MTAAKAASNSSGEWTLLADPLSRARSTPSQLGRGVNDGVLCVTKSNRERGGGEGGATSTRDRSLLLLLPPPPPPPPDAGRLYKHAAGRGVRIGPKTFMTKKNSLLSSYIHPLCVCVCVAAPAPPSTHAVFVVPANTQVFFRAVITHHVSESPPFPPHRPPTPKTTSHHFSPAYMRSISPCV